MSTEQYRREIERHQKEIARLQQEKAREVAKIASETKRANDAYVAASKTSNASAAQSKIREAARYEQAAITCQKKVADIEAKIAKEQARSNDAHRNLSEAQKREDTRRLQDQRRAEQASQRTLQSIRGTLVQHEHLHRVAFCALEKLQHLPERITVLFLAANPLDQKQLRLDEEVRLIGEMIRRSEHRDAVLLESRWAVRPLDVLQAINECRPRVIHFSGHGSDRDEIVFQDDAGNTKLVSKEAIVQTIAAASDEIQLVFFNTCYSRQQAESIVEHVPAAIGMNTSIGDEAARIFAAQFYSSIGFGHSIGLAFRQARAALMLESVPEERTPELFVTAGLAEDDIVLVCRQSAGELEAQGTPGRWHFSG